MIYTDLSFFSVWLTYFNMNTDQKKLTDILGFYFLVFQQTLFSNYMKCWVDGAEDYNFYTKEELENFVSLSNDYSLKRKMRTAFRDTGIFLWDVENNNIQRLNASLTNEQDIIQHILKKALELQSLKNQNGGSDLFTVNKNYIEIKK